jgi:hypothetical protein
MSAPAGAKGATGSATRGCRATWCSTSASWSRPAATIGLRRVPRLARPANVFVAANWHASYLYDKRGAAVLARWIA